MRSAVAKEYCDQIRDRLQFFHFLEGGDMCDLLTYFDCRKIAAGDEIWQEGSSGEFAAFIFSGQVEERKATEFGRQVVVGIYGPGTIVGEPGIIDRQPRAATAAALEETFLLLLTGEKLQELLAANPVLGAKLLQGMVIALSARLRQCFGRMASIF